MDRISRGISLGLVLAIALYAAGAWAYRSAGPSYLIVNLILAFIPLALGRGLLGSLRRHTWSDLRPWVWLAGWLGFLPNSFYLLTDITHLVDTQPGFGPLYAAVVFWWFAVLGVAMGFSSLWEVQRELGRRLSATGGYLVAELILLLVSVAIYLGKVLRWNSWDLVFHPLAVGRDAALTLARPTVGGAIMILALFGLLSGLYVAIWVMVHKHKHKHFHAKPTG